MLRFASAAIVALCAGLVVGCGGGGDDDGGGAGPTPSFEMSLSPTALSIQAGSSGSFTVSITRTAFNDAVTVTIETNNPGLTAPAASIATGSSATTVTVNVAATATTGVSTLTVRATGGALPQRTASMQVTVTAAPAPSIGLSASPTTLSIAQGQSGSADLTIARTNFTGTVTLSAGGGPAGMTFAFTPTSVTGSSATMGITVATTTVPGSYTVTVQGTAVGLSNATTSIAVTVTGPPAAIALSAAPPTLSIPQGQSGTSQLTITRTNFTGTVNLTSSGVPVGMTVALSPTSTTATTVALTVAVSAALVAGNYAINVQAAGSGVANTSIVVPVTVTVPGGSGNVTFTFCQQSGLPIWFAYSDEGGAFTRLTSTSGVYNFTVGQKGRVAWVMPEGTRTRLELFYGSLQDLSARGRSFCRGNGSSKTVAANVIGVGSGQSVSVAMAGGFATATGPVASPIMLQNVQDGLADLIAVRQTSAIPAVTNSIVLLRDRNDANGATIPVDFSAGVAPVVRTATIVNLGGDEAAMVGGFLSRNGTQANFSFDISGAGATRTWQSLPDANVGNGDWHTQTVIATPATASGGFPFRSYQLFTRLGLDRTLTLPDPITNPPTFVVSATAPYLTFSSQWLIQSAQYNDFWQLVFTPAAGNVSAVTISGTVGYFGGGPARLDLPSFDSTFNPQHGLQAGIPLAWTFFVAGGTAWGNSIGHGPLPNEGEFATTAGIAGTFTP